ncbi:MAG: hypothetical protein CM15mP32_3420 [Flavobacteriaceae bacterium]|nr:MAG: hypothetical protein CM15mP32_3420 [Flavobacteriaceae bacterium]
MASLNEHTQPLDTRLTKHLLRRACFHYSKSDLNQYVGKTPNEILNLLSSVKTFTMEWPKRSSNSWKFISVFRNTRRILVKHWKFGLMALTHVVKIEKEV